MDLGGRPAVSKATKKARGTYRKTSHNHDAPDLPILLDPGETPEILSERGQEMYNNLTTTLIEHKIISDIDLNLVLLLCLEYEKYYEMWKMEQKHGSVNVSERTKATQSSGYAREKTQALKNIIELSKLLSLTPGLRNRLRITKETIDDDPAADLING